jgi:hypothetical protein
VLGADKKFWAITGMVGLFSEVHDYPDRKIIEANVEGRALFSGYLKRISATGTISSTPVRSWNFLAFRQASVASAVVDFGR